MRSVNKVILVGNLTRDPDMRETPSGQPVCTFGLATNREWVTQTGEHKSTSEFHECVAWARLADICGKYLKKSKLIYVEGYLKTRSWETPEGVKKFKTEIIVQDMIMLEKRPRTDDYTPNENTNKPTTSKNEPIVEQTEKPVVEQTESTDQPKDPSPKPKKEKPKPKKEKESTEEKPTEEEKSDVNIDTELGL